MPHKTDQNKTSEAEQKKSNAPLANNPILSGAATPLLQSTHAHYDAIQTPRESKPTLPYKKLRLLLSSYVFFANAFSETSQLKAGLEDVPEKILGLIKRSPTADWIITVLFFLQSLDHDSKKLTNDGVDTIFHLLKDPRMLPEWKELSKKDERKARALAAFICSFAIFSDSITFAYFLRQLHCSTPVSILAGVGGGIAMIPTESLETYFAIRSLYSDKSRSHAEEMQPDRSCSEKLTETGYTSLKFLLRFFGGAQNAIGRYASITTIFNITSPSANWILLYFSLQNGTVDTCFREQDCNEAVDRFRARLSKGKPTLKEIVALGLTILTGLMIAEAQYRLTAAMLSDPDTALPPPLPERLPDVVTTIISAGTGAQFLASSGSHLYSFFTKIMDKTSQLFSKCAEYCYPSKVAAATESADGIVIDISTLKSKPTWSPTFFSAGTQNPSTTKLAAPPIPRKLSPSS